MTDTVSRGAVVPAHDPERLADDLAFAAEIGLTHVRLDVAWAAGAPKAGAIHEGLFEALAGAAQHARSLGLAPWFRLLQADLPHWFEDDGGFTAAATAGRWWPRWVEAVAARLGDVAAGWVPFEAPFAMARRMVPDDPRKHGELVDTLVVAWRDAWRVLGGGEIGRAHV